MKYGSTLSNAMNNFKMTIMIGNKLNHSIVVNIKNIAGERIVKTDGCLVEVIN